MRGQTPDAIWTRIISVEMPNAQKQMANLKLMRTTAAKKVSAIVQKEVRRRALILLKSSRDSVVRARKLAREVLQHLRGEENKGKETAKQQQRDAERQRKREEEAREQTRQDRKLNFLLTQTELFSHFIARKGEPSELEQSPTNANATGADAEFAQLEGRAHQMTQQAVQSQLKVDCCISKLISSAENRRVRSQRCCSSRQRSASAIRRNRAHSTTKDPSSRFERISIERFALASELVRPRHQRYPR